MENQESNKKAADSEQSCIPGKRVTFENSDIDPGFKTEEEGSDQPIIIQEVDHSNPENAAQYGEKAEQGTERGAPGLGELDGTNPGSNSHPMDKE